MFSLVVLRAPYRWYDLYVCIVLIRHKSFDRIFFIFEFFNHKIRKMMTKKGEDEKYGRLLRSTVPGIHNIMGIE